MDNSDVTTGFAELNKEKQTKFLVDLCNAFKSRNLANLVRYYAMLYLLDDTGNGWVYSEIYINRVSDEFHVQPRQVKKQIKLMSELGIVHVAKDRVYYRSQEKTIDLLGRDITSYLAIKTKISDLRNGVRARSHFQIGKLQAMTDGESVIISRVRRRERFDDPSAITQRKYEKIQGVEKVTNIAIIREWKDGDPIFDRDRDDGFLIWREQIDGCYYLVRRIPNSYNLGYLDKVGIRRRSRVLPNGRSICDPALKIYYDKLPKELDKTIYLFCKFVEAVGMSGLSCAVWETVYHVA